MILIPAVDIRDGRAVRLHRGDFSEETVYAADPLEAARAFVEAGAVLLHVVDLDGAREGRPANLHHLERISALGVRAQYGGGLRSLDSVGSALDAGAERVVLGTAAYADPELLDRALELYGSRVAVAVDVRGGRVSVSGWTEQTELAPERVMSDMEGRGVEHFVYTSVDRDGTLEGPDLAEVERVGAATRGSFVYSGGVSSLEDLQALRALDLPALEGVISGKALYEGRFTVGEALEVVA